MAGKIYKRVVWVWIRVVTIIKSGKIGDFVGGVKWKEVVRIIWERGLEGPKKRTRG